VLLCCLGLLSVFTSFWWTVLQLAGVAFFLVLLVVVVWLGTELREMRIKVQALRKDNAPKREAKKWPEPAGSEGKVDMDVVTAGSGTKVEKPGGISAVSRVKVEQMDGKSAFKAEPELTSADLKEMQETGYTLVSKSHGD